MSDLNDLKPKSETIEVVLRHPATDEPITYPEGKVEKPMTISVYNPWSAGYKKAIHDQTNKRLVKAQKGKKSSYTAEDLEAGAMELLSKVTTGWDIQLGGEKPKFTPAKAVQVFTDFPWIRDQIEEALNDTSGFLKA